MGIHLDAPAPSEQRARASPVKNDLISCSWLNFLRIWSLLKTRSDSVNGVVAVFGIDTFKSLNSKINFATYA
jgi:hypothetical protein